MKRLLLILAFISSPAWAIDFGKFDTIGFHTLTRHDPGNGANDINLGVYGKTDKGYLIGGYYNSHYRMAYYAGWASPEWNRLTVSFVGVTGYFAPITAIVIPSVRLWTFDNGLSLHLSGSPVKLTEDGQSVLHISASMRF